MVKKAEMPIQMEKVLSSEFHMAMLRELESHHDEKSQDWSTIHPHEVLDQAADHVIAWAEDGDRKHLVHAANYLAIAWAILGLAEAVERLKIDRAN